MLLWRRIDRIPVLREEVTAVGRASDRLIVLDAPGAREDRRRPELIAVGLRREADRAPNSRIARVVEAKLLVVEVLGVWPERAAVAGCPGERRGGPRRQVAVGALEAALAAPPDLKKAQRLLRFGPEVAGDLDGEATGV